MKVMKFSILIVLLSFFVLSCNSRKTSGNIYDIFPEAVSLISAREVVIEDYLSFISRMAIMDSIVIVQSYNSSHNFYAYSIYSGLPMNKLVAYGRSINESMWANMQNPYQDNFVMYDVNKSVLGILPLEQLDDTSVVFERISIQKEPSFMYTPDVNMLSGGRFLFKGYDEVKNTVFKITDKDFKTLYDFGSVDEVKLNEEISSKGVLATQQGSIVVNREGTHWVYTSNCGTTIRFFDGSNRNEIPEETNAYHYDVPEFKIVGTRAAMLENNVVGVLSATCGNGKYYMLHQSKTILEDKQKRSGNVVLVFDLSGKPLCKYKLDRDVKLISYCEKTNSLFGLSVNEKEQDVLIEFELVL